MLEAQENEFLLGNVVPTSGLAHPWKIRQSCETPNKENQNPSLYFIFHVLFFPIFMEKQRYLPLEGRARTGQTLRFGRIRRWAPTARESKRNLRSIFPAHQTPPRRISSIEQRERRPHGRPNQILTQP